MTPSSSSCLTHPYAGQVYLATAPSLEKQGWLKFGCTRRTAVQRAKEHAGALSTERSSPVVVRDSLDCEKAEALFRELLKDLKLLPAGRKELTTCSLKKATALLELAIRDAPVRTALAIEEPTYRGRLSSDHPVANELLAMPWGIGKQVLAVENWLLSSLETASLAAKLQRYGVVCTNASRTAPEFLLQGKVLNDAQVWLASKGLRASRLQEKEARLFRWTR